MSARTTLISPSNRRASVKVAAWWWLLWKTIISSQTTMVGETSRHRVVAMLTTWSLSLMHRPLWAITGISSSRHLWKWVDSPHLQITSSRNWNSSNRILRHRVQTTYWVVKSARYFSIHLWRRWIRVCCRAAFTRMHLFLLRMGCRLWRKRKTAKKARTIWMNQLNI
jgi:hypothetical protein